MTLKKRQIRQQGIALIAVLWVVAALGLMVVGMIHVVKGEIRIASQLQRATLDAGVADAAIRMVLQQTLQANRKEFKTIQSTSVEVFGRSVQVDFIPLNGMINLNHAPISLLSQVFKISAGLAEGQATAIAQAIDQERKKPNPKGEPAKMHSVEDLLRIPGIDYDIYARVHSVFTVDMDDTQKVNPLAAPLAVLTVLAQGNEGIAQQIIQNRVAQGETTDTTRLSGEHTQISGSPIITARAIVSSGDNTQVARSWRLSLSGDAYGLPWRVLGKDAPFQINAQNSP